MIITPKRKTKTGALYHNCPLNNSEVTDLDCLVCRHVERVEPLQVKYRIHCNAPGASPVQAFEPPKAHDSVKSFKGMQVVQSPAHIWVEPKLDGARALVHVLPDGSVHFCSRRRDSTGQFREYQDNIPHLRDHPGFKRLAAQGGCILDGEVIMEPFDDRPTLSSTMAVVGADPDYAQAVQARVGNASLWLFDICRFNHEDIGDMALSSRRGILRTLFEFDHVIRLVPAVYAKTPDDKITAWERFLSQGYEGAVLKDPDSTYTQSRAWLKLKQQVTIDAQITGWEFGRAGGKWADTLGALKVSVLNPDRVLIEVADVIPGDDATRDNLFQLMRHMPDEEIAALHMIVELQGQGWSVDARIRHPRILRFRPDVSAPNVVDFDTIQRI